MPFFRNEDDTTLRVDKIPPAADDILRVAQMRYHSCGMDDIQRYALIRYRLRRMIYRAGRG